MASRPEPLPTEPSFRKVGRFIKWLGEVGQWDRKREKRLRAAAVWAGSTSQHTAQFAQKCILKTAGPNHPCVLRLSHYHTNRPKMMPSPDSGNQLCFRFARSHAGILHKATSPCTSRTRHAQRSASRRPGKPTTASSSFVPPPDAVDVEANNQGVRAPPRKEQHSPGRMPQVIEGGIQILKVLSPRLDPRYFLPR